jgi:hypothetical protein
MNKTLPGSIATIVFCLFAYLFPVAHAYATPNLQFTPSSVTSVVNTTFQIDLHINVDTNNALASDVVVNYAGSDLEVISVTNGGFFPQFGFGPAIANMNGTLEIHGYTTSGDSNITGTGSLAKIVFKAKKSSGSSAISITCTGDTSNTNILTTSGTNILTCTQINQVGVSYSTGITPTPTSTPISTPTPTLPVGVTPTATPLITPTPTPTTAPSSNIVPYCASISTDITVVKGVPREISISCSGVDPSGYINGAEFWFGDGTSQLVIKNVGSPGTVTTTHTYTKAGVYALSCKVRDNDQVYSLLPDVCKKTLTIQANSSLPTATPIKKSGSSVVIATPTPQVISMVEETPETLPYPEISSSPIENTAEEKTESPLKYLWMLAGIIPLILIIRLFRRRNPPIPPIQPPTTDTQQYPAPKF